MAQILNEKQLLKDLNMYDIFSRYLILYEIRDGVFATEEPREWDEAPFYVKVDVKKNKAWINHREITLEDIEIMIDSFECGPIKPYEFYKTVAWEKIQKLTGIDPNDYWVDEDKWNEMEAMPRKAARIVIKTTRGFGCNPITSDVLVITSYQISYKVKVEMMGRLLETSTSKIPFHNTIDVEGSTMSKIFDFATNASFEVKDDCFVVDGGGIELKVYFNNKTKKQVNVCSESLKQSCPDLYKLTQMISKMLCNSVIRPLFYNL